jgi:hypothetical protein
VQASVSESGTSWRCEASAGRRQCLDEIERAMESAPTFPTTFRTIRLARHALTGSGPETCTQNWVNKLTKVAALGSVIYLATDFDKGQRSVMQMPKIVTGLAPDELPGAVRIRSKEETKKILRWGEAKYQRNKHLIERVVVDGRENFTDEGILKFLKSRTMKPGARGRGASHD